jgi:hypothetical protein
MFTKNAARAALAGTGRDPQVIDRLENAIGVGAITPGPAAATSGAAVAADLIGSDRCTAMGIAVRAYAPVLALCRRLIEAGIDPGRPLHLYRGDTLALVVRSIDEGARLTVEDNRLGHPRFVRWRPRSDGAALPMRPNGGARTSGHSGRRPVRMNWTRARHRQRRHQQGTQSVNDDPPFISPLLPRRVRPAQQSKAKLRSQAAAAFLEWRARQKDR